jgi:hypothetical protein
MDGVLGATGPTGIAFIPYAASTDLVSTTGLFQQTSTTYTNFYDTTNPVGISFTKNQTATGLLITANGPYFHSSTTTTPGGGMYIGANINGIDYDIGFALRNTLNDYSSGSFCNFVAINLPANTYVIQLRWKVVSADQVYAVDANAKWTMVIQECAF